MDTKKAAFLTRLVGGTLADEADGFEALDNDRREAANKATAFLTLEKKAELRERLTYRVEDKRGKKHGTSHHEDGQEKEIDTYRSTRKGYAIVSEDKGKVDRALEEIVSVLEEIRRSKGKDGKPLFPPTVLEDGTMEPHPDLADFLADEVLTPLVREGVLPENLITDEHSETQKLLNAAYNRYKAALAKAEDSEEEDQAETRMNLGGANGTLKQMSAFSAVISERLDHQRQKMGISPSTVRRANIGVEVAKLGGRFEKTLVTNMRYASSDAYEQAQATLARRGHDGVTQQKWNERMAKTSVRAGVSTTLAVVDVVQTGTELKGKLEEEVPDDLLRRTRELDDALDALGKAYDTTFRGMGDAAGEALEGFFLRSVKRDGLLAKALGGEPKGLDIVADLGDALEASVEDALDDALTRAAKRRSPAPTGTTTPDLTKLGERAKNEFLRLADGRLLGQQIAASAEAPWKPVVTAFETTLTTIFTKEVAEALAAEFKDTSFLLDVSGRVAVPDEEAVLEDMKAADEEVAAFERTLTLVDDGGELVAGQKNIEQLIHDLQQDQLILEMASSLGGLLGAAGRGVGQVTTLAVNATGAVVGEVLGAVKAAQLIVKLSVNIVRAAKRWQLWYAFHKSLEHAKKARSSLTSTVQGFLDNKKEQITFHTIEDALTAVQIAGAILTSVPEPMTFAVGKALGATATLAKQTNKVAGKVYNEVQLTRAWSITRAALNNPRDRATGLKALRLNPTLAMHAIAWAGLTKGDPIARIVLDAVGLDEKTLESGATEKKVTEYLKTLLYEDRKLLDPEELSVKWAPAKTELTAADWYILCQRAATKAVPKLALGPEAPVTEALKRLDEVKKRIAAHGDQPVPDTDTDALLESLEDVREVLGRYTPQDPSGADHEDMEVMVSKLQKKARDEELEAR